MRRGGDIWADRVERGYQQQQREEWKGIGEREVGKGKGERRVRGTRSSWSMEAGQGRAGYTHIQTHSHTLHTPTHSQSSVTY